MIRKFMVVFLVSFCVKATVLTLTEPAGRDSWELGRIADYIAQGKGYISPFGNEREDDYCIHFAPAIPAYLAGLQICTGSRQGSQAAAAWLNVILSSLTAVLMVRLGMLLLDETTGWTAGILYAFCPASCNFVASSWSATVLALAGIAWLILATRLRETPTSWRIAGFGAATGVLALIDTPFLLVAPVAVLAAVVPSKKMTRIAGGSVLALLAFAIVISPWLYRCWQVTDGKLLPIRGNFGMELWVGNHPGAELPRSKTTRTFHPFSDPPETAIMQRMGEVEYNRYCLQRAKDWISNNPDTFYKLIPIRMALYWLGDSIRSTVSDPLTRIVKVLLQGVPLLLALVGLGLAIRDRRQVLLLAACLLLVPLPHYVTHAGWTRYRLPLDPAIYLLAAYAIVSILRMLKQTEN